MGEIIRFSNYYEKSIYSEITNELKDTKTKKYKFSTITEYANRILSVNKRKSYTLIFTITNKFGIKLYSKKMKSNIYGCIKINGDTKQEYGYEKVILVNNIINDKNIQRVIVAHLLAYYLFDYLGSKNQRNDECYYAEYTKQNYQDEYYYAKYTKWKFLIEKIANRFTMDILMPEKVFINQGKIAHSGAIKFGYVGLSEDTFIEIYLSKFFKVPNTVVAARINYLSKR